MSLLAEHRQLRLRFSKSVTTGAYKEHNQSIYYIIIGKRYHSKCFILLSCFHTKHLAKILCFPIETHLLHRSAGTFRWSNHIFTPNCGGIAREPNRIRVAQAPRVINTQGNVTGGHGCDPGGVWADASNVNRKWKENCFCLQHNCHDEATGGPTENKNGKLYCVATATSDLMAVSFFPPSRLRLHNYFFVGWERINYGVLCVTVNVVSEMRFAELSCGSNITLETVPLWWVLSRRNGPCCMALSCVSVAASHPWWYSGRIT